ncbi:MAG: hypothetical protein R3F62_04435 [Planctomycetota bacterium]
MQPDERYQKQVLDYSAKLRRELAGEVKPAAAARPAPTPRAQPRAQAGLSGSALREELVKRSDTTTLKALSRRGVDQVTVLPMRAMEEIVREAVDQALAARGVGQGEERERLAEDARLRLGKLLRSRRRAQEAAAEEERRRRALEARVRELTAEVSSAQAEVHAADPGLESGSVLALVRGVLEAQGIDRWRSESLELELTRAFGQAQAASRSSREELLTKRLDKLSRALEDSEQALRKLAAMKAIDTGVASIYDTVQGLSDDADDAERKKELLALVFADNVALQLGEDGDVEVAVAAPEPRTQAITDSEFELEPVSSACLETAF